MGGDSGCGTNSFRLGFARRVDLKDEEVESLASALGLSTLEPKDDCGVAGVAGGGAPAACGGGGGGVCRGGVAIEEKSDLGSSSTPAGGRAAGR